jgi:hypothetical protein
MLKKHFRLCVLALACGLPGCVAAPLAQMAVTQMYPSRAACSAGTNCPSSDVVDGISKGLGESFHKLTNLASDGQAAPR